jgi:hypothetical protein
VALRCSWNDLVESKSSGRRWWLLAGAEAVLSKRDDSQSSGAISLPPDLKVLAKQLRINTEIRKQVFAIVMTAEGFV